MITSTAIYRSMRPAALSVVAFGRQSVTSMIEDRRLPVFAAVLVEAGHGTLTTELSGPRPVTAPSLFWLLRDVRHTYGPLAGSSWDERWILFGGALADEFVATELIDPAEPVVELREASDIPLLFGAVQTELGMRSRIGDAAAAASLHRLVTRAAIEAALGAPARQRDSVELVAALRDQAFQNLDLAAFAAKFDISPATLRRKFLAATGLPPKAFQLRLRLDRAKELLATNNHSIERVAETVGFDDSFYFARLFQHRENCTPSEFRRRNQRR